MRLRCRLLGWHDWSAWTLEVVKNLKQESYQQRMCLDCHVLDARKVREPK